MAVKLRWFDRHFHFDFPVALYPDVIERLRGTAARLEDRLRGVPAAVLTRRDGDTWSIQENAGHLLDFEPLDAGRLEDGERTQPARGGETLWDRASAWGGLPGSGSA